MPTDSGLLWGRRAAMHLIFCPGLAWTFAPVGESLAFRLIREVYYWFSSTAYLWTGKLDLRKAREIAATRLASPP